MLGMAYNMDSGVCCFILDNNYHGATHYVYYDYDGTKVVSDRTLDNTLSKYIIRDSRILDIISKIDITESFALIVSSRKPYGIATDLFNHPERYPLANFSDTRYEGSCHIYGVRGIKGGARRTDAYVSRNIARNIPSIDLYKIFFTISYSTNAAIPPAAILGYPQEICTETFLQIGPFQSEAEMLACDKYMKTNFFRFLLYFGKGSMHVTKSVFSLIPLQDFTEQSDIDWFVSIDKVNQQLITKYNLAQSEIAFVNQTISPVSAKKHSKKRAGD
jgi:hypothetical protein